MENALWFLVKTIGGLLIMACVLRAYMHWLGLGARDPIGQFVIAITDWLVKPLRKILPAIRRFDWASLLAALLVSVVLAITFVLLSGIAPNFGWVLLTALTFLIEEAVFLLIILVIAGAVLSWVNPHAPIAPTLNALTNPLLAPIRKVIPLVGGIDLSPMVLIIGLMFIKQLVSGIF
jgi:YggT family protein